MKKLIVSLLLVLGITTAGAAPLVSRDNPYTSSSLGTPVVNSVCMTYGVEFTVTQPMLMDWALFYRSSSDTYPSHFGAIWTVANGVGTSIQTWYWSASLSSYNPITGFALGATPYLFPGTNYVISITLPANVPIQTVSGLTLPSSSSDGRVTAVQSRSIANSACGAATAFPTTISNTSYYLMPVLLPGLFGLYQ